MKKRFALISLIIMVGLLVGGLVMMFNSTTAGRNEGQRAIQAYGGTMDTQQYNNIINSTTENFRTAGMVISLVGGFGLLISGYGVYKEIQ
jgi:hypothetical protein